MINKNRQATANNVFLMKVKELSEPILDEALEYTREKTGYYPNNECINLIKKRLKVK